MMDGSVKKKRFDGRKTAMRILNYLQNYPEAMDTAKGIALWWIREDPSRIQAALETLVERGILEVKNFGTEEYYGLGRAHRGATSLQELLAAGSGKKSGLLSERFGGTRRPRNRQ